MAGRTSAARMPTRHVGAPCSEPEVSSAPRHGSPAPRSHDGSSALRKPASHQTASPRRPPVSIAASSSCLPWRNVLVENRSKAPLGPPRPPPVDGVQFLSVDPDAEQTQQPYVYADDDSVNATDPSGLCWSLAPGIYGPCLPPPPGVPYSGSFTPNEIAEYPEVVRGMNPGDLIRNLDWTAYDLPEGWKIEAGQGESVGPGWKLFNEGDGGYQFRWSPGSAQRNTPDRSVLENLKWTLW